MKNILLLIFLLFLPSCFSSEKKIKNQWPIPSKYKQEFKSALDSLESGRYQLAIEGFESVAGKQKTGHLKWSALFNAGSAYLQLGQCDKSKSVLSELAQQVDDDYKFKPQILLQLHYSYECLNEPHKALAVLKDVDKRRAFLSDEVKLVEIPARFSILYAQIKNDNQALRFQNLALKGLKTIKSSIKDSAVLAETASKLFYVMGKSRVHEQHLKIHEYLLTLPYHQIYLTQSFLLSDSVWAPQSRTELQRLYSKLWPAYKKLPAHQKKTYKNKIMQSINNFQKIARDSQSKELENLLSAIVKKALVVMKND